MKILVVFFLLFSVWCGESIYGDWTTGSPTTKGEGIITMNTCYGLESVDTNDNGLTDRVCEWYWVDGNKIRYSTTYVRKNLTPLSCVFRRYKQRHLSVKTKIPQNLNHSDILTLAKEAFLKAGFEDNKEEIIRIRDYDTDAVVLNSEVLRNNCELNCMTESDENALSLFSRKKRFG